MSERRYIRKCWFIGLLVALLVLGAEAQDNKSMAVFKVKDNKIYLVISKNLGMNALAGFTRQYNLSDIGLYQLLGSGVDDSLKKNGWNIAADQSTYIVTKPIAGVNDLGNAEDKIIFSAIPTPENWRVMGGNKIIYGVNQFRNYQSVKQEDGIVYFYLKGYDRARKVRLAGNFTNWQYGAFPMTRTEDGWMVKVKLDPNVYYYKFIVNENGWMTDPANDLRENDGRGNINSMVFITNKSFSLKGYEQAQQVYIAGSFNNWDQQSIPMKRTDKGWQIDMYLSEGTYQYEFIVDGKVIRANDANIGDNRSVTAIGNAYPFMLKGFTDAHRVAVAGNFNDWKSDQLFMKRTADGWVLPYVLGPGNYQYKFIVDGRWITDPANNNIVDDGKGNENSFMVIGANFTFRLNGFQNARRVFLAGDFNDWSERGIPMIKTNGGWEGKVYLGKGKHRYKFIVDGKWILDPDNKQWEQNEFGTGNSVIWLD